MEKKSTFPFLVVCAIPHRKDTAGHDIAPQDRLKDAIHKAHRDVLTGRFHFKNYCSLKQTDGLNEMENNLYELICAKEKQNTALISMDLINKLQERFYDIEFGAVQKLVNMTLKYILILNAFEQTNIPVNESACDCPLDSVILGKLENRHSKWTKMEFEEYEEVQNEIRKKMKNKPAIYFDFENWQ